MERILGNKANKRIILYALLPVLAILLAALPGWTVQAEEAAVVEITGQGEIISDVNVRKGPGTDHEKIGALRQQETVSVTGKTSDGWYRVVYEGGEGFVYGQYIAVTEEERTPPPEETGDEGELQEQQEPLPEDKEEEGISRNKDLIRAFAILVIIGVILGLIILTIRSMKQSDEKPEDPYEDEEDYDEDGYEDDEYADDNEYGEDDEGEDAENAAKEKRRGTAQSIEQPILIREEDYQLHIDPIYFEEEPIAQPEFVTGYLARKEAQEKEAGAENDPAGKEKEAGAENDPAKKAKGTDKEDLQKAMDKLQELQEEIERLKRNQ